ncbi:DUF2850 domain-containing protein [Vibrio kyushuensis]|uniref:DUF2850 domain-containing protein n=1 Tax=Vibrio kyushuensis TaxID=2910249 RepID=UPI003D113F34
MMANVRKAPQTVFKREPPKRNVKRAKKRKWREIAVILMIVAISAAVVLTYSYLYKMIRISMVDQESVHGVWVEQNVAGYATNKINIGPDGVSVAGGIVATRYEFDGTVLEYQTGSTEYHFRMTNEENTQMIQISDSHYNPVYRLDGKYTEPLRKY